MAGHNHKSCITAALKRAELVCEADNARLTPVRKRVLELVWGSHRAAKTYDILETLEKENASAKPPTVYRALEFLEEHGLVHKVESLRAYVGCEHPERRHVCYFLICDSCGQVAECCDEQIAGAVAARAAKERFRISAQHLEIRGECYDCRKN